MASKNDVWIRQCVARDIVSVLHGLSGIIRDLIVYDSEIDIKKVRKYLSNAEKMLSKARLHIQ